MLASHRELARRLDELEQRYDAQFKAVDDAIRQLMAPPAAPKRRIGSGLVRGAEPELTSLLWMSAGILEMAEKSFELGK
jgi:hypothetical protein